MKQKSMSNVLVAMIVVFIVIPVILVILEMSFDRITFYWGELVRFVGVVLYGIFSIIAIRKIYLFKKSLGIAITILMIGLPITILGLELSELPPDSILWGFLNNIH